MDKNELVAQINLVAVKIDHLEQKEDLLLQNLFLGPKGEKIFSVALDVQSHHFRLSSVREKIYNLGAEHCDLIESLRQVDYDLALKLNRSFFHNMLMRLEQLRVELSIYDAKDRAVKEKNAVHASYNRELVTKIKHFFDYYPGC
ncbi:MAG: hypothetical protein JOS17DRAFT_789800 [Linnemannia elongata]|nr:MAG: hypothetical protein JOS17DRAFT_789800 [Linnemannia elongata]